ncbi:MAG: alanine racemase [Chitinophagales bacterium]
MMHSLRPTWAEIDLGAIAHNIKQVKNKLQPGSSLMAVIKANAYGHGTVEVARVCANEGADFLAVALLDEACQLRDHGIKTPILILGYSPREGLDTVVRSGFRQTIYDWESALALSEAALKADQPAMVHIKLDTGMSRIGFFPDKDSVDTVIRISKLPGLVIEGIFTHFALADSLERSYTNQQLERFNRFISSLSDMGLKIPFRHAANSAGILEYPEAHLDMVRAGISIYGMRPSDEVRMDGLNLIPAMRLISHVVMIKELPAGTPVSYGCTYVTDRPTLVATVPVGYGDGYIRAYSNRAWASIRGKRVPMIGRVCMDYCMFDVTALDEVSMGDEVTMFGREEDGITADNLAEIAQTINYEVVCLVNSRVPRVYVNKR